MTQENKTPGALTTPALGTERGFAMISALLVMVLMTALGSAAIFMSQLDLTLAGNYRVQRQAEVSADGALDLVKAMIFGNTPLLHLPLSIPATDAAARAWRAGADTNGDGSGDGVSYSDQDLTVHVTIQYKQEDNINFNTGETFADEVVRYGKDYNYQDAQKDHGRQPVYSVSFRDEKTGVKGVADLLSSIGFRTPAAIYVKGRIRMEKNPYANEEMIEVTSGAVTPGSTPPPAVATTKSKSDTNVFIQRAVSLPIATGATRSYTDQEGSTHAYFADYRAEPSLCLLTNPGAILTHPNPSTPYCPLTTLNISTGIYAPPKRCWPNLYPRVYGDAEITNEIASGRYNEAREMMHILLGVGERSANLNGAASYADSKSLFNFDVNDTAVVRYNYANPDGTIPTLEDMLGTTFADLRSLADVVLTGDQTVRDYNCGTLNGGKDLSGMTLGSLARPQLVFFESNMNDNGTPNGHAPLALVTNSGAVHGYGILVINGDATIYGSIDWTGLMLVRGKLVFKPWQGGTGNFRSGPDLMSRWNGFIMIGGDPSSGYGLHLWTYFGGGINLGFSSSEAATIKGIISSTVPHKVLSWRRAYD